MKKTLFSFIILIGMFSCKRKYECCKHYTSIEPNESPYNYCRKFKLTRKEADHYEEVNTYPVSMNSEGDIIEKCEAICQRESNFL